MTAREVSRAAQYRDLTLHEFSKKLRCQECKGEGSTGDNITVQGFFRDVRDINRAEREIRNRAALCTGSHDARVLRRTG